MLISLHQDKPVINPEVYKGSVVVEFARYKNWGEELDRGMVLIDHEEWRGGYLFRVSLHAPTIYRVHTISRTDVSTRSDNYVITLMRGSDHSGWALEIGQERTLVTIVLDHFDSNLKFPLKASTMTLWEHLEEEV